ncbi:MAG TPA: hypothetical protein VF727_16910 [Allosphingosinicella sp.]|jgi:hypothetical protein
MKKILTFSCLAVAAGCTMNAPVDTAARAEGEAELSAALANYQPAGPPVSCVEMRDLRGNRTEGDAIVFDGPGDRIWVNRPAGGCPSMRLGRALQTRTTSTRLCRGDIATVFDPVSGSEFGGCGLGDFEPYRRRPR